MAMKLIDKIRFIFLQSNIKVTFEEVLKNFRAFKNFLSLDFKVHSRNGLEVARRQELTETEIEIKNILLENSFHDFETHASIDGLSKVLNVDFVIPRANNPHIVIETFLVNSKWKFLHRISEIDHRFQMLKLKNPNLRTLLVIKFTKPIIMETMRKFIQLELLNTDNLLINEEMEQLPELLKMLHPAATPSSFRSEGAMSDWSNIFYHPYPQSSSSQRSYARLCTHARSFRIL